MGKKSTNHTHKYHLVQLKIGKVWACALPKCSHYMPIHLEELVPGKESLCWDCNKPTILDPINMKDDRPICINCRTGINSEDLDIDIEARRNNMKKLFDMTPKKKIS